MKNKLLIVSLFIIVCICGFLYWTTLQDQIQLPSEEWSRTFQVNIDNGNFSKLQSVQEENGHTVSLLDFKKLIVFSCDNDMECKKNRTIDTINTYKNSWSNQTDSYFIRENSLIHSNSSTGETEIASNVENFSKTENTIVYWTEDQNLIVLTSPFDTVKQRIKLNEPVSYVKIFEKDILIVTENKNEGLFTLYNLSSELSQLFQFYISSQYILSSVHIIEQTDNNFILILDKKVSAGGATTKSIESASFNLTTHQTPTFNKLLFVESQTGIQLKNIQYPNIYPGKQGPIITFSSTFYDLSGEKVTKVFVGDMLGNTIHVNAATKAGNRYERSILLNEQTVAYLKMKGKIRFLEYSSSDEIIKQKSTEVMTGDYKETSYTLLSKFFNGFILVLFSIVWIILTFGITYGTLLLLHKMKFAHSHKTAFIVHIIALFSIQTYFIYQFTSLESIISNIPFITESWHFVVLLLISSILSTIPLFILRYKVYEDTFNVCVLYTTFMNLIILFLLVGPYIF